MSLPSCNYYIACAANLESLARCLRPDIKQDYLRLADTYREMGARAQAIRNKSDQLNRLGQSTFNKANK